MKNEKTICLCLPEELYNIMKQAADEDYMNVNAFIRLSIVKYLQSRNVNE